VGRRIRRKTGAMKLIAELLGVEGMIARA